MPIDYLCTKFITMRQLFLLLPLLGFIACGTSPETKDTADTTTEVDATVEMPTLHVYGDSISTDGALLPNDMLAMMDGKDSLAVKVEAPINQTCKMKGCWMTLDMGNEQQMRVRFKDYGFFVPKEGAEGKIAVVEGYAFVDTLSVDHLRHLAEDAGQTAEEIAAINEPEISINFEAHGVVIKE